MTGDSLTPAELEVAKLLADGLSDQEIADRLGISIHTVQNHRDHIFAKLGFHNRTELARWAVAMGHVPVAWTPRPDRE